MRQYLKNEVFKVSKWVELFISAIIMIAVIGGTIYLVKDVVQLMMNYPTSRDIYKFVGVAFNLVICIEFVKMLCKHTPDTLVEVMMFAIARQMDRGTYEPTAESYSSFSNRDFICDQEILFWKV